MAARLNLLLVDGDPMLRMIAEIALTLDPLIAVRAVDSGEAAIVAAAEPATPCDGVLLIGLPDLSAGAAIEALNAVDATRALSVIVFVRPDSGADAYAGVTAVIATPFDPLTLAADVRQHLEYRAAEHA